MRPHTTLLFLWLVAAALALPACNGSGGRVAVGNPPEPLFAAQLFGVRSFEVTNTYLPLVPGTTHTFTVETADGVETIIVQVLDETRFVAGIECAVVRDRVYLDGLLIEDTHDWYAQDLNGNVWYMGEEVFNYEYDDEGNLIGTDSAGAWEAGKDVAGTGTLAEPGILMKATISIGDTYRQEYYAGEAEDMGEIVAVNVTVVLEDGSRFSCLQTRDWTPLEPGVVAFKYYARGIGVVLEEEGGDRLELRGRFDVTGASLPDFSAATFSNPTNITNPYLPWSPGTTRTFAEEGEDESETVIVDVLDVTRVINGIECVVVRDRVYVDELLIEDTHDWYAQDDQGNVWYMGEEVVNYEYDDEGNLLGTDPGGSWEAGVDGAEAGILMYANPPLGVSYFQEFYEEEAEDMAVVIATGVTVDLPCGVSFANCRKILEWTPLEPDALEYKYFAPGQGVVLEEPLDGSAPVEFLGAFFTGDGSLPDIGAASFSNPSLLTHPYLNFTVGNTFTYEVETDEGIEEILVEVLPDTRLVDGILCRVVRDRVWLDGVLIEDTHDWYAQDDQGNVWYMGEDVVNYEYDEEGNLVDTNDDGAWEAGVDGAEAGILIWATQVVGRSQRQEFYEDEAEDMAVVVSTSVTVVLEDGTTYPNCLKTLEGTPLEPFALEYKFYAAGVGLVAEQPVPGDERIELTGP